MKKLIGLAISALLFASLPANATSIGRKLVNLESKYGGRSDVVAVIFYSEKNPYSVEAKVKNLMQTRDPAGFFNPYWVTNFYETEVDKKSGCGFVIGKWYGSGYPSRGTWEPIMDRGLPRITDNATYLYMINGSWVDTVPQRSQSEALGKLCG
ncbi:MAG: hypothetical protein KGV46_03480 [Pasteurella sp.]|nr:hypothetical protein [Pasteurella sp.]